MLSLPLKMLYHRQPFELELLALLVFALEGLPVATVIAIAEGIRFDQIKPA